MDSCKTCPSFVPEDQVSVQFGRSVGAPMCKRFGYVLGRPGLDDNQNDVIAEHFPLVCGSYGDAAPMNIPEIPWTEIVDPGEPVAPEEPSVVRSCRNCENCVKSDVVSTELGYPIDLCKAKGKLILSVRSECKNCPFAVAGTPANTTTNVTLLPQYREDYAIPVERAIRALVGNSQADPRTYPTDRTVTAADAKDGIRSWRKLTDPEGSGKEAWLPIFDPGNFNAAELMMIPQAGDDTHPETYIDYAGILYTFAAEAFEQDETLALQGPPGLGKTEFSRWVAYLMQVPFRRFSFTSSSEVDDMIGKMMYDPEKGTYFHYGRLVDAYRRPGVMVLDELNLAEPALREALRPLFDNNKQLVLDAGLGEAVNRDQFCFLLIAQNPAWDIRNTGAREGDDADYNRLSVIDIPFPPEAVERHIITERCRLDEYAIEQRTLNAIMAIARDIREASSQDTLPFTWGIRQQIKVARKTKYYGLLTAYKRAALDFYDPNVAEIVVRIIKDHVDPDAKKAMPVNDPPEDYGF